MFSLNDVTIAGQLDRDPTTIGSDAASPCTSARVCIAEDRDGQVYKTYVSIDAYGKSAQVLAGLHEGDVLLIRGALKWKKATDPHAKAPGQLVVRAWSVQRLQAAQEVPV